MATTLSRLPLTRALLDQLALLQTPASVPVPIGDGQKPRSGGFTGEPDEVGVSFVPYLVLNANEVGNFSGSFGDPQGQAQASYTLMGVGVARDQAEWVCDRGRAFLDALKGTVLQLGDDHWRIQQVWTDAVGQPVPNFSVTPALWSQRDRFTVWLSKEDNP